MGLRLVMNDVDEKVEFETTDVTAQFLWRAVGLFVDDELPVGGSAEVTNVAPQRLHLLVHHVCWAVKGGGGSRVGVVIKLDKGNIGKY